MKLGDLTLHKNQSRMNQGLASLLGYSQLHPWGFLYPVVPELSHLHVFIYFSSDLEAPDFRSSSVVSCGALLTLVDLER